MAQNDWKNKYEKLTATIRTHFDTHAKLLAASAADYKKTVPHHIKVGKYIACSSLIDKIEEIEAE